MALKRYEQLDCQLLAGEWRLGSGNSCLVDRDPYTDEVLLEIPYASHEDIDANYRKAEESQKKWAQTLPAERAAVMRKAAEIMQSRREEFIEWVVKESGSAMGKAVFEVDGAVGHILETTSFPARRSGKILASMTPYQESFVYREPLGVVTVISPWNFAFALSMRSVAGALMLGNAVVIKPSSDTPVTGGILLGRLFEEAGLPKGVISVVVTKGSENGDYLVEHPVPSLISFTGSCEVGQRLGAKVIGGKYVKRIALEMGGNAPLVVLEDADLQAAAEAAVVGRFLHQGQICMSTNRVIVVESVYEEFTDLLVKIASGLKMGNPMDEEVFIGPIINDRQAAKITGMLKRALEDGAQILLGGEVKGRMIPPHILGNVKEEWEIAKEEIFGPILPVIKAKDEEDALRIANDTLYGLSSAVFTKNESRGIAFARGIRAGMTHINSITVDDQVNVPFGGEKNSGIGRFNSDWFIEEFTRTHWITLQHGEEYPYRS